jgi:hypothetical protein
MAAVKASSVYPEFKGIWKFIDFNEMSRLASSPDLRENINAKQRGYTPLYLVRSPFRLVLRSSGLHQTQFSFSSGKLDFIKISDSARFY